jgi:hypothetical protein
VSTLALARSTLADQVENFIEPRIPPHKWRGLVVRTPYFAAADLDSSEASKLTKLGTVPKTRYWRDMKTQTFNSGGMLDALRFYGISGWSPSLGDK